MAEREGLGSAASRHGSLSTGRLQRPELVIQGGWASAAHPGNVLCSRLEVTESNGMSTDLGVRTLRFWSSFSSFSRLFSTLGFPTLCTWRTLDWTGDVQTSL